MPRIRKKTSKRGTTNKRKRISEKVKESRKREKKATKKNPQWKSKKSKDPGIPNNFPFKDQVLAEVSEQRRIVVEEKQRKKEERKAQRAIVKSEDENDGVDAVAAKRLSKAKALIRPAALYAEEGKEENRIPVLINRDLPNLKAVLKESDVIIQVLDARDPLSFWSSHIESIVEENPVKRTVFVLNKIDLCPRESVTAWATYLRQKYPTFIFRSASAFLPLEQGTFEGNGKSKAASLDGLGADPILACLGQWAQMRQGDAPLSVAVLGFVNVGKSSFINSLLRKAVLPIYSTATSSRGPTTTEFPQEVTLEASGKYIRLIDTPGLSWEITETSGNLDDIRARDILMRSKGRIDRMKDPASAISRIVSRSNAEDLMLLYNLPAFTQGDPNSFLSGIARSHRLIKKKGELDSMGASRIVLRDWSTGKFSRYTMPPTKEAIFATEAVDSALDEHYATDESILTKLLSRKDMRKSRGLIRLMSGVIETRRAIIEEQWNNLTEKDDNEDADEGVNEGRTEVDEIDVDEDVEESDEEDADADEDDSQEEEEGVITPISNKQKRRRLSASGANLPPRKKVTFGPDSKGPKPHKAQSYKGKATVSKKPAMLNTGGDKTYDFGKFF